MPLVITRLIGGLGNQMFQYAAGRAVAHRYNLPLLMDTSGFEHYDLRRYELGELSIQAQVATEDDLMGAGIKAKVPTTFSRLTKVLGLGRPTNLLKEASFAYDARIEEVTAPIYLDGYWQSERYFLHIASLLRQEFALKAPFDAANERISTQIREAGPNAVSLHIRRGDYVTNLQTAQYHGACSLDYYRAAVDRLKEHVAEPDFFVFSDDLNWASDNLKLNHNLTLVNVNDSDRGMWDMALMVECRHHVIANSSFSWWGAWLGKNPCKKVIAPKRWFANSEHDTKDLLPAAWLKI